MQVKLASSVRSSAMVARGLRVGWFCALTCSLAGQPAVADEPRDLAVISYNVQFLPGVAQIANKRKQPAYRALELGRQLARFDIVCLQEVFEHQHRERLLAGLREAWGEAYQGVAISKPNDQRFMGGVAIAARLPLVETNEHIYTVASSPQKYGVMADGFAAKGVLHARLARAKGAPHDYIDVFVTHLEAREDALRPTQYRELAEFVRQHTSADHPVLITGDMNTHGNTEDLADPQSAYHDMFEVYQAARPGVPLVDLWTAAGQGPAGTNDQEAADGGDRIDYIFLSNPAGPPRLEPQCAKVNRFLDDQVGALSDHSAVEAAFIWHSTP